MISDVRLARRIMMTVRRGRVKVVDDTGVIQIHQVDLGPQGPNGSLGIRDNTPVANLFGFTSVPPTDADAIMLSVGGDTSIGVVIGHNHQQYRLKNLGAGDAALYDQRGAYAWFKSTGLVIDAAGLDVTIQNAANVTVTASTKVVVNAPTVELGGAGGPAVARVGDTVNLSTGLIETGSSKVSAT